MAEQNPSNRSDLSIWNTENLRLTVFLSPAAQVNVQQQNWWADLVGVPPEKTISQPREGVHQEEGAFSEGKLILTIQPLRVDWLLTVSDEQLQQPEKNFTVGVFPNVLESFTKSMLSWLEIAPAIQRIALGAILVQPVDTIETGYQAISSYLPLQLDPENSSDLLYQINRPRVFDLDESIKLKINRLSQWAVSTSIVSVLLPNQIQQQTVTVTGISVRLVLDINTAQDFQGEFSRDQLPKIFRTLIEFGQEIAEQGDIQ